jgi:spore maturation protein CgeB
MTPPTILVVAPGAAFSTIDVFHGVTSGLAAAGARVITYSLHGRMAESQKSMNWAWRQRRKVDAAFPKPSMADLSYHACLGLFERCYRFEPDVVLFISGVLVIKDVFTLIRKRHTVAVLLTESPYLMEQEQRIARSVDLVWTHERDALDALRSVQPETHYLRHAWLPATHGGAAAVPDMPAHDVVFVGTDFAERIALLEAVDWTGIDLGLYGNWSSLKRSSPLQRYVREAFISNAAAASLYRRCKIGLNLYRTTGDFSGRVVEHAWSLNPRAYELAACGAFSISSGRGEVAETFGDLVPTFTTARELEHLVRQWLADDAGRERIAAQLPACVSGDHWLARGRQLLGDLQRLRSRAA